MSSPGFLDFFVLEASEYVEQLDGILLQGGTDTEGLVRNARALRGTATMAKLAPFADLASALERVGRALREGALKWTPALTGAVTSTVDDLKLLIRSARTWSATDDQRVSTRVAELMKYAPAAAPAAPAPAPNPASGSSFFATESANIAAGLELLATRPADKDAAANVLRRVRALRGVAGIKDTPPLAEVMEGAEAIARPLELGQSELGADRIAALRAAAVLLRRAATALRDTGAATVPPSEREAFFAALQALQERDRGAGRIVPITELFFADAGPHVVSAAPHPPTTPAERFRLEVVSQGEHLRGLVADARRGGDAAAHDRVRRELRQALMDVRRDAESFGEIEVSNLVAAHLDAVQSLDYLALNALESLAQALASPGTQGEKLAARLAALRVEGAAGRATNGGASAGRAPEPPPRRPSGAVSSTAPTPVITPAIRASASMPNAVPGAPPGGVGGALPVPSLSSMGPAAGASAGSAKAAAIATSPSPTANVSPSSRETSGGARSLTPGSAHRVGTPRDTMAVLDQGIDSLSSLAARPMSEPVDLPEQPLVPIDALLYRGRAAIDRAIELREEIRRHGGAAPTDTLDELFDLLDLAKTE